MKILIPTGIYPPDIGGPASYVPKISSRFLSDDIIPIVITYSSVDTDEKYDNLGFQVIRIKRTRFFVFNYIKYFFSVLKYGKGVDLIFLQDYFSAGIPTFLANFILKKRLITKVVGIFSWEQSMNLGLTKDLLDDYILKIQKFYLELLKKIERYIINKSFKVIVPSNYMAELISKFGIKKDKIEVVYNSFDYFSYEKIDKNELKGILNISQDKKVYISVGRLVEWKNFDKLIINFKSLENSILYIIGDGPLREKLTNLIKNNNLEDRIFLLGSLSKQELYKYYQIANIFVLISSYEGMSHVLLEAMSMNLFIISSDIKANIETLNDYKNKKIISLKSEKIDLSFENKLDIKVNLDIYDFERLYIYLKKILIGNI